MGGKYVVEIIPSTFTSTGYKQISGFNSEGNRIFVLRLESNNEEKDLETLCQLMNENVDLFI